MGTSDTLELSPEEMRKTGYRLVDFLVDYLAGLRERPVTSIAGRQWLDARLEQPWPEQPRAMDEILAELHDQVLPHMGRTNHPRFFAFVPSPGNFVSAATEMLISGLNVFAGNWLEGSAAAQVELLTLDWLRRACGLPDGAGGLFVSGGSVANLTALAVARRVLLSDEGHRAQPGALQGARIYASDQVHSSIARALRVLGFGPEQLVRIAADEQFRLPLSALAEHMAADRKAGLRPFCVVASAGTTNTGAIDPLRELAGFCRREGLWLHADGAYGAAAALCDRGKALLEGLGEADSLTIDPHKWLFQPYEIGCVLLKDKGQLLETFAVSAEYLRDSQRFGEAANFQDQGIQLTRSFRALKLWLSINFFGMGAFRAAIERGFANAERVQELVGASADLQLVSPAQLAVVAFRYVRAGATEEQIDRWNREIVDKMLSGGFATVTSTVLRGRTVLRMCTINPRTTDEDLVQTVAQIVEFGREAAG